MTAISPTLRRRLIAQRRQMLTQNAVYSRSELLEAVAATCDQRAPDALDRVLQHPWWMENSDESPSAASTFTSFRTRHRPDREKELDEARMDSIPWADQQWLACAWATIQESDIFDVSLATTLSRIAMIGRLADARVAP